MSALVIDCSVAMTWCLDDERSTATDELLDTIAEVGGLAPPLWRWEVANVLVVAVRRGRLPAQGVEMALSLLDALPVEIDMACADNAWTTTTKLAEAHGLTVYDAAYLELALRRKATLASKDEALRQAAVRAGLAVLP